MFTSQEGSIDLPWQSNSQFIKSEEYYILTLIKGKILCNIIL